MQIERTLIEFFNDASYVLFIVVLWEVFHNYIDPLESNKKIYLFALVILLYIAKIHFFNPHYKP